MRILFMIFTIAERSFKILDFSCTHLVRRRSHSYGYDFISPTHIELSREATRLIIRRLQRTVLRLIRDSEFGMSEPGPSIQRPAHNTGKQSVDAPPQQAHDESPFGANRKGAGQQDSNCRTCNDFKSWSKQQRLFSNVQSAKAKHMAATEKVTVNAADLQRDDCPLDKVRLGISTWGLLHTMAAFYSDNPTDNEKRDMKNFFEVLSRLYPCEFCAKDFRTDLDVNPINVSSQKELSLWLCKFHNRVNDKLGKPLFDCSKVNERWRDGWLDGSCD
ncbi:hypothetical protein KR054_004718 [Drosophila jambulina]|nr:hypothetical protein KR054_004718 [Drosophila jambulina]